jgi:hypothetical protein
MVFNTCCDLRKVRRARAARAVLSLLTSLPAWSPPLLHTDVPNPGAVLPQRPRVSRGLGGASTALMLCAAARCVSDRSWLSSFLCQPGEMVRPQLADRAFSIEGLQKKMRNKEYAARIAAVTHTCLVPDAKRLLRPCAATLPS